MARVYVAPISFGLGDLVVSVPVLQALIADNALAGDETWLVARSASQAALSERIPGLAGYVDEEALPPLSGGERVVDLRDHPLQRDHWWGSPEFEATFGPLDINQILDRIARDFGIIADFSAPTPLRSSPVPGLARTVLLVTETDGPAKAWPAAKWESLAAQLRPRFEVRQVTRTATGGDLDPLIAPALPLPEPWCDRRRPLFLSWCHRDRHRAHPHRRAAANTDGHHLPARLGVLPSLVPRPRPARCALR